MLCTYRRLVVVRAMGPLTVCILSIAISNIWNLKSPPHNIRVVGTIPKVRLLWCSAVNLAFLPVCGMSL